MAAKPAITKQPPPPPLWFGSVSNPSSVSAHSLTPPMQSGPVGGSSSHHKMATSIVTTSPQSSCHESSLCASTVVSSVVVSRTPTSRPAPFPRQMSSSSSSSNSHPSSPAMLSGPKTSRYPPPPTSHRLGSDRQQQQNHIPQSVNRDELSSIISGPLSDTISFIPSMEDCAPVVSTSQRMMAADTTVLPVNFQFMSAPPKSNGSGGQAKHTTETSITTTTVTTTTVAVSGIVSSQAAAKNCNGNPPAANSCQRVNNTEMEKRCRNVEPVVGPCLNVLAGNSSHNGSMPTMKPGGGPPIMPSSQAPFLTPAASSRMSAYNFYPPNMGAAMPKSTSSVYYANKGNPARFNGKGSQGSHRRNGRNEPPSEGKQRQQMEHHHSTSSSQYSSPSQTPSPDIKKTDKLEGGDPSSEVMESGMMNGFAPMQGGPNMYTDNTSPPPIYNQYPMHTGHPRHHRYVSFPQQQMGFIPYPHPHGMYRYPIPNHHMMMGARPPPPQPPPAATGPIDKSSREATPPSALNINQLEGGATSVGGSALKPEVPPTPSASSVGGGGLAANRKSVSPPGYTPQDVPPIGMPPGAPPPNHIGHGPLPYNGPNYQMIPGPFFTPVPGGFVSGHASLGNGYVSQMPPNFSLPPMTEIMYQSPYAMMGGGGGCTTGGGGPPFQQAMMGIGGGGKPTKRSVTCYNCGLGGHTGSDCNESSMVELTKCTT